VDKLNVDKKSFYKGKIAGDLVATTVGSALTADGIKNTVIGLGGLSFGTMISSAGGVAVGAPVAVASGVLAVAGVVESAYGATVLLSSARNMGSDMQKLGDAMSSPEDAGSSVDILSNKTLTNQTGKVNNYVSGSQGNAAAQADFNALNPSNVRTYPNGTIVGDLPNGRTVNLHPSSSLGGTPTVEIFDPATGLRTKIRY
jgi:hypothetical protein